MSNIGQIMAECDCQHTQCETLGYCMADRIEELEAKLAKAVDALHVVTVKRRAARLDDAKFVARATLAELTGGKDE